jgi:ABC-type amino acid transport substrate-binding protein
MKRISTHSRSSILLAVAFVALWHLPDIAAWLEHEPDGAWVRVQSSGVIRFATDASYHPFEGVGSDGVFYGLDIDIGREIARRFGARAEFVNAGMDALYDVLSVGQADASISALPVDPARLGKWAYSQPYFDAGLVLIAREDAVRLETIAPEAKLSGVGDLAGRVIAAALGSEGDAWLRSYRRRADGIMAAHFDSAVDAVRAVAEGRVDGAVVDGVAARQLLATQFEELHITAQLTNEPYVVTVWGESTELLVAIDGALSNMEVDGTLARLVDDWMRK